MFYLPETNALLFEILKIREILMMAVRVSSTELQED